VHPTVRGRFGNSYLAVSIPEVPLMRGKRSGKYAGIYFLRRICGPFLV